MPSATGHDQRQESDPHLRLTPTDLPLTGRQPVAAGAQKPLSFAKLASVREQIKQAVIDHYRANKERYPAFIRQRRDLIIGHVMKGSTLEEAFGAEVSRRR